MYTFEIFMSAKNPDARTHAPLIGNARGTQWRDLHDLKNKYFKQGDEKCSPISDGNLNGNKHAIYMSLKKVPCRSPFRTLHSFKY